jgi:hypothetical protein
VGTEGKKEAKTSKQREGHQTRVKKICFLLCTWTIVARDRDSLRFRVFRVQSHCIAATATATVAAYHDSF